jgi:hypothetical protein
MSLELKKFPSAKRRCRSCRPVVGRNLCRRYLSRFKGYRFEILTTLRQLDWIDAPPTQNFEILKSLEQTQESKTYSDFDYFEIRLRVLLKNSKIYLKNGQKISKSVWVETGKLKFGKNMFCKFKLKTAKYSEKF